MKTTKPLRASRLALIATLLLAPSFVRAEYNWLSNPQWDPTTTNGTDGGRHWTFTNVSTTNRAYQLNDSYNLGHPGSGVGAVGMVKVQNSGTVANTYHFAQSPWFPANPGNQWTASAWFRKDGPGLPGDQAGLLKVEIADATFAVISTVTTNVITASSGSGYVLGNLRITVPAAGVYVRMQVGLNSPSAGNGQGQILIDDASLTTPHQVLPNPGWDPTTIGGADGGRWWAKYTYTNGNERAYQRNDDSNAGRNPVANSALGYLKVFVDGTVAQDFQHAASGWFLSNPGDAWTASVFGGQVNLQSGQVGTVVLQYADSSTNLLASVTNAFLPAGSGSGYKLGIVSEAAPINTAYVQMLVGVFCTNAAGAVGNCLFEDASLTSTNQVLTSPGWDPNRVKDTDGGRGWTFSGSGGDRAYALNDSFNVGRYPSGNGARGVCKAEVSGTIAGSLQTASSEWHPAAAGSLWKAAAYARTEGASIKGSQVAFIRLEFADAATNVLSIVSNTVLTSASPQNSYRLGAAQDTAPSGTAFVRMMVGVFAASTSDGAGYALFDDARLSRIPGVPATVTLTSSANPSGFQDAVQFIATVLTNGISASGATGSIIFSTNGVPFATNTVAAGAATSPPVSTLLRGTTIVGAIYSGSVNYSAASGTLNQTVTNHPPTAETFTFGVAQGEAIKVWIVNGAKSIAADVDGDALSLITLGTPDAVDYGTAVITDGGASLAYTNSSGPVGSVDTFSYIISDGFGGLATNTLSVRISPAIGSNLIAATTDGLNAILTYAGIPGTNYALDHATSLTPPINWTQVQVKTASASGVIRFTNLLSQYPTNSFFRTRDVP